MRMRPAKLKVTSIVALLTAALVFADCLPAPAALIGHWKMDEGVGQAVTDSAGSSDGTRGANATPGAADPAWNGSGKIGSDSLSFDGTNDWVNFGDVLDQGSGDFSVSMWLNASASLTTATSGGRLVQKRGTGAIGTVAGWQIVVHRVGTDVMIGNTDWDDGGGDFEFISGSQPVTPFDIGDTGDWIQLISTFDNTNDKWIFYADGVEVENIDVSSDIGSVDNNRSLTFGAADLSPSPTQFYNGLLDDIGIFSGVLSAPEATAVYTLGDDTDPLGNGADLNYHLGNAQDLFDVHNAGSGLVTIDGLTWYYAENLTTGLGELTKLDSFYSLRLDAFGGGLTTKPIPEPSSLLLLGLGGIGMLSCRRRRRRQKPGGQRRDDSTEVLDTPETAKRSCSSMPIVGPRFSNKVSSAALCLATLLVVTATADAATFTAAQAGGTGAGSASNYGQSFTANVAGDGVPLASGNPDNVWLTSITLFSGTVQGSGAHYLNIYDGFIDTSDSGPGNFVGSSSTTVTFGGRVIDDPMTWNFDNLVLDYDAGTKYFAVLSTTDVAGSVTFGGQSLRLRNTGIAAIDDYAGGELQHNDVQLFTHDARFTATFETIVVIPEPSTMLLFGLGVSVVVMRNRRRRYRRCRADQT